MSGQLEHLRNAICDEFGLSDDSYGRNPQRSADARTVTAL